MPGIVGSRMSRPVQVVIAGLGIRSFIPRQRYARANAQWTSDPRAGKCGIHYRISLYGMQIYVLQGFYTPKLEP